MEFREHVPLAPYTTFQIGGPARWLVEPSTEAEVVEAIEFARLRDVPLFVLGGGSNLLVSDAGFPGMVLHLATSGSPDIREMPSGRSNARVFSVGAAENWDQFVSFAVSQGCGGVECLTGIPGSVGGTPVQNVGAYGQEVSTTITSVRALDLSTMQYVDLPAASCGFAYRTSIFNTVARGRYLVVRVNFCLPTAAYGAVSYKDLKIYFKDSLGQPTLAQVSSAVRAIRIGKGMVVTPGDADTRSAGSFFKNPLVYVDRLPDLAASANVPLESVPTFPAGPDLVKVPAAWLLEQAGFQKSHKSGRVGISSRHTLALVNLGGARAVEVLELRDQIVAGVYTRFGIELQMEPVIVGPA